MKDVFYRRLLLIEDDPVLAKEIAGFFTEKKNTVVRAATLAAGIAVLQKERFDAVILDLLLPDGDGLELFSLPLGLPPVVILSSLAEERIIISGLHAGALDYIVKPCSPALLEAHLALRMSPRSSAVLHLSGVVLDIVERTAVYRNTVLHLTCSEFNILHFLMRHPDTFFTSSDIYKKVWDAPSLQTTTIRYHISNLRRKLKEITKKNLIRTEFGKGYSFVTSEEEQ